MPEAFCRPRTIRYVNKAAVAAAPFAALALPRVMAETTITITARRRPLRSVVRNSRE